MFCIDHCSNFGIYHSTRLVSVVFHTLAVCAVLRFSILCDALWTFPQTKTLMGEVMKVAAFSLAEVKFAIGGETSLPQVVLQNVNKAQIKVRTKKDNVAGQL